jgi:hypothetical protein
VGMAPGGGYNKVEGMTTEPHGLTIRVVAERVAKERAAAAPG